VNVKNAVLGAIVGLVAVVSMSPAFARGNSRASIWIESGPFASTSSLHYGDQVRFGFTDSYSDPSGGTGPWLQLLCSQNGNLVYSESHAGFEGGYGYGTPFTLGPSVGWQSGGADCSASVGHVAKTGKYVADATMIFAVAP
jgi:hypothetical protein